jgi:drug/metabolite transporter (DMT)-like permease
MILMKHYFRPVAVIDLIFIIGVSRGCRMKIKIWVSLLLVYVFWGSTYLAIRYAVETIPPFLMAGTRFLIAGLIFFVWRRLAGDPAPTRKQWLSAGVIGLLLLLGGNGMISWAEQKVPSGIASLLIGSVPLWMTVIEAILPGGARPNWIGVLGLLAGFSGIALLIGPDLTGVEQFGLQPLSIALLLFAALSWSLGSIYGRHAELPSSGLLGTSMEMLVGGVGLILLGSVTGEWRSFNLSQVAIRSLAGWAWLVIFGSMVAYSAYTRLLRNASLALVSTYAYVNPLIAILLGSLLGGELLTTRILVAAFIIIGSVLVVNLGQRIKRPIPSVSTAD